MTPRSLAIVLCLPAAALAQSKPFTGFGNSALDRKPGRGAPSTPPGSLSMPSRPSPFGTPIVQPTPMPTPSQPPGTLPGSLPGAIPSGTTSASTAAVPGGITLANDWAGRLPQGSGGQTMKMKDLQALLANFGTAEPDVAPHPDVVIYEGQRMDGAPGNNCRITYLMPLRQAEAQLMGSRGIATVAKAVAPGFPDGLMLHTYDVKAGIYNRLCLVTDIGKPDQKVVSMVLKSENANWYAPTPFIKQERDWHTFDYVNTQNRGQPGIVIDTRVSQQKGSIIVNTTGGFNPLKEIEPPGVIIKPARFSPKETTTWYVPEPMVKLILFCVGRQLNAP